MKDERIHVLFLALLLFIPGLGSTPFHSRGEAREALVAQSMWESGNFILPLSYNDKLPSKPPFLHWLVNLFSIPGGEVSEFSARLPSALASCIFGFFFYCFLIKEYGSKLSSLTVFILLTSVEWYRHSFMCRVDMLLSACLCGGLLSFYKWQERGGFKWWLISVCFLSGATLTKGPVGIVLPGVIVALFLFLKRKRWKEILASLLKFTIPVLILPGAWYFLGWVTRGESFLNTVYYENIARFVGGQSDEPHAHNVFYLFGALVLGFLPWSLFPLGQIIASPRVSWKAFREKVSISFDKMPAFKLFSILVIVCVLVFYSIPSSKRGVYLLPLYPFLSFVVADLFLSGSLRVWRGFKRNAESMFYLALFYVVLLLIRVVCIPFFVGPYSPKPFVQEIKDILPKDEKIYSFGSELYALSFYLKRRFYRFEDYRPDVGIVVIEKKNREELLKELTLGQRVETVKESSYDTDGPGVEVLRIVRSTGVARKYLIN